VEALRRNHSKEIISVLLLSIFLSFPPPLLTDTYRNSER
jgi:hypothetical protein